ncbi:MAG: flagellin [Synergistaceae bacterium]|nr:flagellin [Synergistaceae bacterium]
MRIANNLPALTAFNALSGTNSSLQRTITALSTGLRINSASDDAAGFAISEKMRTQIRGLDVALRNSQDGISMLQTAEGALGGINSMLQRMRELSVQASNDTLTSQDRQYIQLEIDELRKQIDMTASTTQFNRHRLLDGSGGALWSSSDASVRAKIDGGLTFRDNFGQKVSSEGNYRIEITADPGSAQVQKTNIMTAISRETVSVSRSSAKVVFVIDVSGSMNGMLTKVKENIRAFKSNIESKGVDDLEIGICTYGTADIADPNFVAYRFPPGTDPSSDEGSLWSSDIDEITELLAPLTAPYGYDTYNYYGVQKAAETYADTFGENRYMILVTDVDHTNYPDSGLSPAGARTDYTEETVRAALFGDASTDLDDIKLTVIGPKAGSEDSEFYNLCNETEGKMLSSYSAWETDLVGMVADSISEDLGADESSNDEFPPRPNKKLSDISNFITPEGNFLLERPKTLTLRQGGRTTSITLDASDTLGSLTEKLDSAVEKGLDQGKYIKGDSPRFATYVYGSEIADYTDHGAPGTILLRSVIPGADGEITLEGDDELLRVLGFNTVRESSESTYNISVYDAHSGKNIASGIKSSGNILQGAISNVDIEFDPMAGITASWSDNLKGYVLTGGEKYTAMLHLKDSTTTLQTGANSGEEFTLQLGDMSSNSLGISGVNVASRETASRSIGLLDRAINRVSKQRAKIGSYINALEHTMTNLTTTSTNLTASESRIRDADMAKTMMDFMKLQILNQSGTSMLAQANQLPQSILSLLGN